MFANYRETGVPMLVILSSMMFVAAFFAAVAVLAHSFASEGSRIFALLRSGGKMAAPAPEMVLRPRVARPRAAVVSRARPAATLRAAA